MTIEMIELSLWLDNYDDIYSDFDSRHYLKRRISEDFLHELRMAKKYRPRTVTDIVLLLPQEKRNEETERIIASSLKDFFKDQFQFHLANYKRKLNRGLIMLVIGLLIMMVNSYINFENLHSLFISIVKTVLDPAGWFLLWFGFDFLFYDLVELKNERNFFAELSNASVHFKSW
jgi:hypothetical protein